MLLQFSLQLPTYSNGVVIRVQRHPFHPFAYKINRHKINSKPIILPKREENFAFRFVKLVPYRVQT